MRSALFFAAAPTSIPTRIRFLSMVLGLATLALGSAIEVNAQALAANLCPVGSPFNIRPPGLTRFTGAGLPMLRKTLDVAAHPEAVCNDGTPAVMYVRPSNHANPTIPASNKWLKAYSASRCRCARRWRVSRIWACSTDTWSR